MKFCPTCETRYDEEILRFCTKDGTPLIDEDQPNFVDSSNAVADAEEVDFGEETVIRFDKPNVPKPPPDPDIDRSEAPRIVIPMTDEPQEQRVRARVIPPYQQLPPRSNTPKVVILTILGTIGVLVFGFALFYLLRADDEPSNTNLNINTNPPNMNVNLNTNLNVGNYNFNINASTPINMNLGLNTNTNANRTPSPTPKPSPSPTPTSNLNTNSPPPVNATPTTPATPRPTTTTTSTPAAPRPSPTPNKPSGNNNH